jgi:NYN domain
MAHPTSKNKQSVSIYCDNQNVHLNLEEIDTLVNFCQIKGNIKSKKAYFNFDFPDQVRGKEKFYEKGFTCIDVPCPLKNSADNQLIANLVRDIRRNPLDSDIVILVSGDGDFTDLVHLLKTNGKYVVVIGRRGNVKQSLKEEASEFHYISDLPKVIQDTVQPEITANKPQIDYHQVVYYLTEAIKTALEKGQKAALGNINNLMMQMFPKYQGVSCIRSSDGKSFKKFSDFISAVVKDGKVKLQNQSLLLLE